MNIQFCKPNFCDLKTNTTFALTATPTSLWYQDDINLLYDHTSKKKLFTTGANDDTTSVYLTLDMIDLSFVNTVKLLNTNIKSGAIEVSEDAITWTTLYTITDNSATSIHWYESSYLTEYDWLQTADGRIIYTVDGLPLDVVTPNLGRYLRITATETIIPDEEKFIGELYVGQMAMNLTTGKILNYRESKPDPRKTDFRQYMGYRTGIQVNDVYNSSFTLLRPSSAEVEFFSNLETKSYMYDFFPAPDTYSESIDYNLSINDVYLIQAFGNYNRYNYGNGNKGTFDIILEETVVVS